MYAGMFAMLVLLVLSSSVISISDATLRCGATPTLEGTNYSIDTDNYLCKKVTEEFPLPCIPPRNDYPAQTEFVITAWWPPVVEQLPAYKEANFNTVFTDNAIYSHECWKDYPNTIYAPNTTYAPARMFKCIETMIRRIGEMELKAVYSTLNSPNYYATRVNDHETLTYGGVPTQGGMFIGDTSNYNASKTLYSSKPEVAWILAELQKNNLMENITHFFLHDDLYQPGAWIAEMVTELKGKLVPIIDTLSWAPEASHETRVPIWSPEQYAINGQGDPSFQSMQQLILLMNDQMFCERYGLDSWPLLSMGSGGSDAGGWSSDSLVRFSLYGALLFGAKGFYDFTWGEDLWIMDKRPDGHLYGPNGTIGKPGPNYEFVKEANGDSLIWGKLLLKAKHVGTMTTADCGPGVGTHAFVDTRQCVHPSLIRPIVDMGLKLLVGLFTRSKTLGYLMVVNMEVGNTVNSVRPRNVEILLSSDCKGKLIAGIDKNSTNVIIDSLVRLRLTGGKGQLIEVEGEECLAKMRAVRQWWNAPGGLSLSPYADAYAQSASIPDGFVASTYSTPQANGGNGFSTNNGNNVQNKVDHGTRYKHPGGLSDDQNGQNPFASEWSRFLIGGDLSLATEPTAKYYIDAGFNTVLANITDPLIKTFLYSRTYGIHVVLTDFSSPDQLRGVMGNLSCHPGLAGAMFDAAVLSNTEIVSLGDELRQIAYWQFALARHVGNYTRASELFDKNLPFSLIAPAAKPFSKYSSTEQYASDVISNYLTSAPNGELQNQVRISVEIDACDTNSDSALRLAAYSALAFGMESIWWEGMNKCAKPNTEKFALLGAINGRIAQWSNVFSGPSGDKTRAFSINNIYSTANFSIPGALKPGASPSSLVQKMDDDVIVLDLSSPSSHTDFEIGSLFFVISTRLSKQANGSPTRNIDLVLQNDVQAVQPIEGNCFQGNCACSMCKKGWNVSLKLPGGSAQLMGYNVFGPVPNAKVQQPLDDLRARMKKKRSRMNFYGNKP